MLKHHQNPYHVRLDPSAVTNIAANTLAIITRLPATEESGEKPSQYTRPHGQPIQPHTYILPGKPTSTDADTS